jgi:hypothetical protein
MVIVAAAVVVWLLVVVVFVALGRAAALGDRVACRAMIERRRESARWN